MIQALNSGLGIPAKSLIEAQSPFAAPDELEDWNKYPIKDICERNWILFSYREAKSEPVKAFNRFFAPVIGLQNVGAFYRKSSPHIRTGRQMNRFALFAWPTRITTCALENPPEKKWRPGSLDLEKYPRASSFECCSGRTVKGSRQTSGIWKFADRGAPPSKDIS